MDVDAANQRSALVLAAKFAATNAGGRNCRSPYWRTSEFAVRAPAAGWGGFTTAWIHGSHRLVKGNIGRSSTLNRGEWLLQSSELGIQSWCGRLGADFGLANSCNQSVWFERRVLSRSRTRWLRRSRRDKRSSVGLSAQQICGCSRTRYYWRMDAGEL